MPPVEWSFRVLNGSGSSPGEIIDHRLQLRDSESTFAIVQRVDGNVDIREESESESAVREAGTDVISTIIARIRTSA